MMLVVTFSFHSMLYSLIKSAKREASAEGSTGAALMIWYRVLESRVRELYLVNGGYCRYNSLTEASPGRTLVLLCT